LLDAPQLCLICFTVRNPYYVFHTQLPHVSNCQFSGTAQMPCLPNFRAIYLQHLCSIHFFKQLHTCRCLFSLGSYVHSTWFLTKLSNIIDNQFADGSFDVILDKGGLDALMEPEAGTKLGMKYLNEVCWLSYVEFYILLFSLWKRCIKETLWKCYFIHD
jgi:hypothetical protein